MSVSCRRLLIDVVVRHVALALAGILMLKLRGDLLREIVRSCLLLLARVAKAPHPLGTKPIILKWTLIECLKLAVNQFHS